MKDVDPTIETSILGYVNSIDGKVFCMRELLKIVFVQFV